MDMKFLLDEVKVVRGYKGDVTHFEPVADRSVLVVLDVQPDQALIEEGLARQVVNYVQRLRKKSGLTVDDAIEVFYELDEQNSPVAKVLSSRRKEIHDAIGRGFLPYSFISSSSHSAAFNGELVQSKVSLSLGDAQHPVVLRIHRAAPALHPPHLSEKLSSHFETPEQTEAFICDLATLLASRDYHAVSTSFANHPTTSVRLNGKEVTLVHGYDVFISHTERFSCVHNP